MYNLAMNIQPACITYKTYIYICGGRGIVGNHVWVTVVACTCMLSCTPHKVIA